MLQLSLAQVRASAARLLATGLAIVIAVGFIVATLVLNATSKDAVYHAVGAQYTSVDAVLTVPPNLPADADQPDLAQVVSPLRRDLPNIAAAEPDWSAFVQLTKPGGTGRIGAQVTSVASEPSLRWQSLRSGRLPSAPGEVAVANQLEVPVGSTIQLSHESDDAATAATSVTATGMSAPQPVRVVGVVDRRGDPRASGLAQVFATDAQTRVWGGEATGIRVVARHGTTPEQLTNSIGVWTRELNQPLKVTTGQHAADDAVNGYTSTAFTVVLLVFAGIALFVSALVIANTFAVLIAQRTRELALLRCVGASAKQVRRGVLIESAVIGLVASAAGVAGGIGLVAGLVRLAQDHDTTIPLAGLTVPLSAVLIGLGVGTGVTVIAAFAPARRATRVKPLAALRPLDPALLRSRAGLVRAGSGLLLAILGFAVLGLGASRGVLTVGFAGGVLSFIGVMLLARRVVPNVVGLTGRVTGRLGGVPGELASVNAIRNPQRTAATALALLIGVTLTTTMVVGAASTRASAVGILDDHYPADVVVHGSGESPLPPSLVTSLSKADDVRGVLPVQAATLKGPGGDELTVSGVDLAQARTVLRTGSIGALERGVIAMPTDFYGGDGTRITVQGAHGRQSFVIQVNRSVDGPTLPLDELRTLAPQASLDSIAIRLSQSALDSPGDAVGRITDLAGDADSGSYVSGPAQERAAFDKLLNIMLLIVTGLLMVAVVIAIIGVGNTIALSVIERRQENGLLRALGLTRRQLRVMLLWEAALVAGVAAILGVALGVLYGLTGTASVLARQATGGITMDLPLGRILAIVVIATAAGALASVLPSRRAARTSPVEAMAAL